MYKENQRYIKYLLMLSDSMIWLIAMLAAYSVRFYLLPHVSSPPITLSFYLRALPTIIAGYIIIYYANGLYDAFRRMSIISEIGRIIVANFYGLVGIFFVFFWIKEVHISRLVILFFGFFCTVLSASLRISSRLFLRAMRKKGYSTKHLLIVGCNQTSDKFYHQIISNKHYGYVIDGYLNSCDSPYNWKCTRLGDLDQLTTVLQQHAPDEVIISLEYQQFNSLGRIIEACETQGVKSSLLPFYSKYLPTQPRVEVFGDIPVLNLRHIPLDNPLMAMLKRGFDFFAALFGLILLSPLLLAIVVGIKLSSPGPVIYKQIRIGKNRKEFIMYKFRSMRVEDNSDTTTWGSRNDARRTRFGAIMRKFSIDELPQLYNVLKGDMSLVGPRPERPFFVERFREEVPLYMLKHLVRPGITGWAQVNGWRGDTSILERIKCDMFYIENWSFLLDIKILLMTLIKGIVNPSEEL